MKVSKWIRAVGAVAAAVLLVAVGTVLGQGPEGTEGREGEESSVDGDAIILAQPPYTMNYQGYLTDSSGTPLDGTYDLAFRLYNDASAGTVQWGPETHNDVPVANGLFQVALGAIVNLYPNDFDEALFLAVQVNGTAVTPRQPLRSVPYAFGLVPGAEVEGDPRGSVYALRVENTGTDDPDRGIYARGKQYGLYASGGQYGIYAKRTGDGDVGIYSPDFVRAKGFRSNQDSYVWVPATASMLSPSEGCELYPKWHGTVALECSTAGPKAIDIPIVVPAVLYGQEVRVEQVNVYYDLDSTGSYIDRSFLRRFTNAVDSATLINDYTDRTSTSPTSYSLTPTWNYTLTTASGALNLFVGIKHDGNTSHDVYIGGVRVRLGHYDEQ